MADTSKQMAALNQVKAQIDALIDGGSVLVGISKPSVIIRKLPIAIEFAREQNRIAGQLPMPGIVLAPFGRDEIAQSTNATDDLGFPVSVDLLVDDDQDLQANPDTVLKYREDLLDEFRTRRLVATNPVADFMKCVVRPGPIIDAGVWLTHGKIVSSFQLVFYTRVQRGN